MCYLRYTRKSTTKSTTILSAVCSKLTLLCQSSARLSIEVKGNASKSFRLINRHMSIYHGRRTEGGEICTNYAQNYNGRLQRP